MTTSNPLAHLPPSTLEGIADGSVSIVVERMEQQPVTVDYHTGECYRYSSDHPECIRLPSHVIATYKLEAINPPLTPGQTFVIPATPGGDACINGTTIEVVSVGWKQVKEMSDQPSHWFVEAVNLMMQNQRLGISAIQRHLRLGYSDASRMFESVKNSGFAYPDGYRLRPIKSWGPVQETDYVWTYELAVQRRKGDDDE